MYAPLQCKVAILFKQRNFEFSLYALNFDGTYATYIQIRLKIDANVSAQLRMPAYT